MEGSLCRPPAIQLLGAALDPLDHPERVALKQAFAAGLVQGTVPPDLPRDPYDALTQALALGNGASFTLAGKLDLPGWLTPRPGPEWAEFLAPRHFRVFLDENRCRAVADDCCNWITRKILPQVPGLIAVDHSLAGGAMRAVAERYGPESVSFLVLDAHFDGLPTHLRQPSAQDPYPAPDTFHCGSFLHYLLEEGTVLPQNLVLVGVSDYPGRASSRQDALARAYLSWADRGVTFITKSQVRSPAPLARLKQRLDAARTPWVYVSLDADVGACAGIPAVRFLDRVGLEAEEILAIAQEIGSRVRARQFRLAGFDVSEVDVHLLGLEEDDPTISVCLEFIERLCGGMACHAPAGGGND